MSEEHQRITSKYLSKYEKAKIIGERAMQLEQGAQPLVDVKPGEIDTLSIAERELASGALKDMVVRRSLPNGGFEDWTADELLPIN